MIQACACLCLGVLLLLAGAPARADDTAAIQALVARTAMQYSVPVDLALAVAEVESDFRPDVESHAGARGVMQIMPATAWSEYRTGPEALWNPELNVRIGVSFLKRLHRQYGGDWTRALSHYNGGTLKGRGNDARIHDYTRGYIARVQRARHKYKGYAQTSDLHLAAASRRATTGGHGAAGPSPAPVKPVAGATPLWQTHLDQADYWLANAEGRPAAVPDSALEQPAPSTVSSAADPYAAKPLPRTSPQSRRPRPRLTVRLQGLGQETSVAAGPIP